jgi:hypothetical protein
MKQKRLIESDCLGYDMRLAGKGDYSPGIYDGLSWDGDNRRIVAEVFSDHVIYKSGIETFAGFRTEGTQKIELSRTTCNYGGNRTWFICPDCNRRTLNLYWRVTDGIPDLRHEKLSCRTCHGLVYASERRDRGKGDLIRANRIYAKIGGKYGKRPKFMRRKTYDELMQQAKGYEEKAQNSCQFELMKAEAAPLNFEMLDFS